MPPVVSSLFGSLRMPVVMGMIITGWGPGYLMASSRFLKYPSHQEKNANTSQGAPIAGYLLAAYGGEHDSLNSYHPAIFFAGSAALASCLLVGLVRVKSDKRIFRRV